MKKILFSGIIIFLLLQSCSTKTKNYLENSKSVLYNVNNQKNVVYNFKEKFKILGHNSEPWETTNYKRKGKIQINNTIFFKEDTLINSRGKKYTSKIEFNNESLLYLDYGDKELKPITKDLFFEEAIKTARYSPLIVLENFIKNKTKAKIVETTAIYSSKIGKYAVQLYINTKTNLVDKITYLKYDELYGDVITTFNYSSYVTIKNITYPTSIKIEKINGKVIENVQVSFDKISSKIVNLLEKPADYTLVASEEKPITKIETTKYNEYIYFIDLEHTNDRVMVVELDDYMLVAEAPINPKNGELIISEVKKIAPLKSIKYFAFGHHHPHYLGGLRAFVHKEATILCTEISKNYVNYIANTPHTLKPDSLHLEKKKLKTQIISDSLVLGNKNKMKIYLIGDKSAHTKDYLIYYFPEDKLLFQDDLCWIPQNGAIKKAGKRQAGLYNAVKELNLNIDTIIQSWPVKSHKVKTIIPFTDLEKSMFIK